MSLRSTTRGSSFEWRRVAVRGRQIGYQVGGAGEPVVLVHGLAGSMRWWCRNIEALARHPTVYLVNLPGFGAFQKGGLRFTLADAADWLADWVDAVGIAPCHVVAHSMGGYLTVRLAARHPDLVRRLVLVAPAGFPSGRPLLRHAGPLVAAGLAASPSFLPILALDTLRAGLPTIVRAARDLLAEDVRADLGTVTAPTLLVWGDRDALVPVSLAPLMRSALGDARLLLLSGAGHVAQYDRAAQFNTAALGFLADRSIGE